jgi:hypothetical protein
MRIDHLVTQFYDRLESGDFQTSGGTEGGGTGNLRSREGAAAVMARAVAPKVKKTPPPEHPDLGYGRDKGKNSHFGLTLL